MTRKHLLSSAIVLAITTSGLSYAETTESKNTQASMEEVLVTGKYTINEQIDTATGLGLTLFETPQSVSVMTAQRLQDQNLRSLTDVVNNATGVSAKAQDSTRYKFSARGFAIDNYQIDGIPISWEPGANAGETSTDTSIYERVEIVRGATGLLTGAGNPSASINMVRKHADSREFTGSTMVSAGRWNTYKFNTDISTPLNDSGSVRGRFVATYEEGDSFRDLAGEESSVFYGVIDADLTDCTLLRVGASYQQNKPTASTWGGLPVWYSDGSRTDWDRSKTTATKWSTWSSDVENYYVDLVHTFSNDWTAKLSVNYNVNQSDQLLLYISGTVDKTTGLGLNASPRNAGTKRKQTNISLQVNGTYQLFDREHDLTFGVIDSDQDEENYSLAVDYTALQAPGNFFLWDGSYPQPAWGAKGQDVDLKTEQSGIYAATRLSVTDSLKLIFGGRVADWSKKGSTYGTPVDYGDTGVFIPYAGALYDITEQHSVYASFTEIFQPQPEQDRTGNFLDPITGKSYELGLKSRFFDESLQTTLAVFKIQQDDLAQVDTGFIVPGTINGQAYYAAEGTESEGFELEVVGQLAAGWDLSFSYTQFEAEDANGAEVNTDQPRQMMKLYTTYNFGGSLSNLTIAGGVNWEGRNYTDTVNPITGQPERLKQDEYSLVSLMARYDFTPQLSAQLNVDNLLDETYYSQIGFYNQLEYGEPRNATLSMNYQF
ncbi:TonB-dependent siderophore receptor [Pseudomaricurvus sp.]|uniref:TonB-dependent siderophore receptor n=1 Tax=Pseudomaricurvus sp. TaxID=2004510 RepID=UPI003F6B1760